MNDVNKKCFKCKEIKNINDFPKKGKYYHSYCKSCFNNYSKEHYKNNPIPYKNRANIARIKNRNMIKEIKESKPCMDCGNSYPYYIMDFDHKEEHKKVHEISRLVRICNDKNIILEEIKKCDLVCANCHRIRTHTRKLKRDISSVG